LITVSRHRWFYYSCEFRYFK